MRSCVVPGMTMPLDPSWEDIAVRLSFTVAAAAIIGIDREARGHVAGLRTTMLVALAASVAMIQANLLLSVSGKTASSFSQMDVMRLPLGILTGVGFIGGGAILRRGDLLSGVTTAATLWAVTVIGLCMGAGQIGLGCAATAIGFATLAALKLVDERIPHMQRAHLAIETEAGEAGVPDLASATSDRCETRFLKQRRAPDGAWVSVFEVRWWGTSTAAPPRDLLASIDKRYRVRSFEIV